MKIRAYEIISDEFEQIKTMLSRNGYSKYVLDKCIREFFYRKFTTKSLLLKKKDSTSKKIFIRLPFLGALLLQIRNELKPFSTNTLMIKPQFTSSTLFQRFEKISALRTNNHF